MSDQDCILRIQDAAPYLSADQAGYLLETVRGVVEAKRADREVADVEEAVFEAVNRMAGDAERAALIALRNTALRLRTRIKLHAQVDSLVLQGRAADIPDYLESLSIGISGHSPFKFSIERSARALQSQAYALFRADLQERGVDINDATRFMQTRDATRLLLAEADEPGAAGNKVAKAVAKAMDRTTEFLRVEANRRGADIARSRGYLVKHAHDQSRMIEAGGEVWVEFILPLLDHDQTFGPGVDSGAKRRILDAVYAAIIAGKPSEIAASLSDTPGFKGVGLVGHHGSHQRLLHFRRDGAASWAYARRFGLTDAGVAFDRGLDGMTRAIAAMIQLGPNPRHMLTETLDYARARLNGVDTKIAEAIDRRLGEVERLYDFAVGDSGGLPASLGFAGVLARTGNWTRTVAGKDLPRGAMPRAIAGAGRAAGRLRIIGAPFMGAHRDALSGILQGRRSGEERAVAAAMMTGLEGLIVGVQSRWLGHDSANGQSAALVGWVMRVTGMNWLNDSLRKAVSLSLSAYLAGIAGTDYGAINANLQREMQAYGISAVEWDAIRASARVVGEKRCIDIDEIADTESRRLFRQFLVGFADSAIAPPGASVQAIAGQFGQPGDILYETAHMFLHLRKFTIDFFDAHLSRFFRNGAGLQFGYAAHLTLSALVFGYFASTLRRVAADQAPHALDSPEVWVDAWRTGGAARLYNDLVLAMLDDNTAPGQELPEPTTVSSSEHAPRRAEIAKGPAKSDTDDAVTTEKRALKTVMPGANIFYPQWTLNYVLWRSMAEYLSPGFARRVEKRARDERSHEYAAGPLVAIN